jgi:hypothetical protein
VGERAVLEEERLEEMGIAGFNETPALQRRQIQRSRNIIRVAPAACVRLFLASKIWLYDGGEENKSGDFCVFLPKETLSTICNHFFWFTTVRNFTPKRRTAPFFSVKLGTHF